VVQFRALRVLRGETPENVTKMSQLQNEPKTNPNEPNFLEGKPYSKRENGGFRQIYENLFMQNEPNGMLLVFKLRWSMSFQKTQKIPNKANLKIEQK